MTQKANEVAIIVKENKTLESIIDEAKIVPDEEKVKKVLKFMEGQNLL